MLKLRLSLALAAASLLAATAANAGDSTKETTYGIRVYEVFQRASALELQERTTRTFSPKHVRNIAVGEVFPPEDQPGMAVYKSRDHLGYFGSFWREDGSSADFGKLKVEVTEVGPGSEPGVALIRVKLVQTELGQAAARRINHPEFVHAGEAKADAAK